MRRVLAGAGLVVTLALAACAPPPPPPPVDPLVGIAAALSAAGYVQQPDGTWVLPQTPATVTPAPPPPPPPPPTTLPSWMRTTHDAGVPFHHITMLDTSPFRRADVYYVIKMNPNGSTLGECCRSATDARLIVYLYPGAFDSQARLNYVIAHENGHVFDWQNAATQAEVLIDAEPWHPAVPEAFADCYGQKRTARISSGYWDCPAHILSVTP